MTETIGTSLFKAIMVAIFTIVIPGSYVHAQTPITTPVTLSELEGEWVSNSPAFGNPGKSTLSVTPVLGGKFIRLEYRINKVEETATTLIFEGIAHYRELATGGYEAFWADSSGDLHPITARSEGPALIADWGRPGSKQGSTRYQLESNGTLTVTDKILRGGEWVQFNKMEFERVAVNTADATGRLVTGIGGLFFRGQDPASLSAWYNKNFRITPVPTSYDQEPWRQESGYTIFSPFKQDTDYFGDDKKQWMVNFRVRDLDALISRLRANGVEVSDPVTYPNGRFSRLTDPEGNPVELWEPSE